MCINTLVDHLDHINRAPTIFTLQSGRGLELLIRLEQSLGTLQIKAECTKTTSPLQPVIAMSSWCRSGVLGSRRSSKRALVPKESANSAGDPKTHLVDPSHTTAHKSEHKWKQALECTIQHHNPRLSFPNWQKIHFLQEKTIQKKKI